LATAYDDIYNVFLNEVNDDLFTLLSADDTEDILYKYMINSCSIFNRVCEVDLSERDDTLGQFDGDLSDEEINIIVAGMIVEWLKPKYFYNENFRNVLKTKDYSKFSPAELTKQIKETYLLAQKEFEKLIIQYSYGSL
jgi:hypothetical protein